MDISIIIPVYNVEKYLLRCLDSIFNQQFFGTFEVISVDDASTDSSLQMLYTYQKNENRLHIITHDINKKQAIARSTGVAASTGNYIMFVDSDDYLLPGALARLHSKITETESDVVVFNYIREDSEGKRRSVNKIKNELISTDKVKVQIHFYGTCVNKIVKRSMTENMESNKVMVHCSEDMLHSTEILLRAEKICLIPENYYVYFKNVESITHTSIPWLYLQNQIIILKHLKIILSKYNADLRFSRNILNYFEKWIYFELGKIHFWNEGVKFEDINLVSGLSNFPYIGKHRLRRMELSIISPIYCLFEITYRFGFKTTLGIIRRSFGRKIL